MATRIQIYFRDEEEDLLNEIAKQAGEQRRALSAQIVYTLQEYYKNQEPEKTGA